MLAPPPEGICKEKPPPVTLKPSTVDRGSNAYVGLSMHPARMKDGHMQACTAHKGIHGTINDPMLALPQHKFDPTSLGH